MIKKENGGGIKEEVLRGKKEIEIFIYKWKNRGVDYFDEKTLWEIYKNQQIPRSYGDNYVIYNLDYDTVVYLVSYLIKGVMGSRELDSIRFWHLIKYIQIFLMIIIMVLIFQKPSISEIKKIISPVQKNAIIQNIDKKDFISSFTWSIIKK